MVSVIIPNYNHAPFLEKRIKSVLDQTYQEFELIILDDASTDESMDILEKYRGHFKVNHFIRNEQNTGSPYRQWVKGVELSVGENIWIAESDDFCDLTFLKRSVEELEKDPMAGLAFCKSVLMNEDGIQPISTLNFFEKLDSGSGKYKGTDFINQFLFNNCILNVSSVVFRKKVFDNFKTDFADLYQFSMFGDWYIYLTVAMRWNIIYFEEPLNYFRRPNNSYSSKEINFAHLKETLILQNYIFKHTHNQTNYNKVLDHLYYEAYGLLNESSLGSVRKLSIASHFIRHDKFGWRRLMHFTYNKIKSRFSVSELSKRPL